MSDITFGRLKKRILDTLGEYSPDSSAVYVADTARDTLISKMPDVISGAIVRMYESLPIGIKEADIRLYRQRKLFESFTLKDEKKVSFTLTNETPVAVYAYCNLHGLWVAEISEPVVCDLPPVDVKSNQNYTVCRCNNVSYFDILDQIHKQSDANDLLAVFEGVKNTTHCSAGCGGCYDKVMAIISAAMYEG